MAVKKPKPVLMKPIKRWTVVDAAGNLVRRIDRDDVSRDYVNSFGREGLPEPGDRIARVEIREVPRG